MKKITDTIDLSSTEKRLYLSIKDVGLMTDYGGQCLKILEEYRVTRSQLEKIAKSKELKDTETISGKLYLAIASIMEHERNILTTIGGMYEGLWPEESANLYKQIKHTLESDSGRCEKLRNEIDARAKEGLLTRCTPARVQKYLTAILTPCRRMLNISTAHFEGLENQPENVQELYYRLIKLHGQVIADLTEVKGDSSTEAAKVLDQRVWSEIRYPSKKLDDKIATYERPLKITSENLRAEVLAKISQGEKIKEVAANERNIPPFEVPSLELSDLAMSDSGSAEVSSPPPEGESVKPSSDEIEQPRKKRGGARAGAGRKRRTPAGAKDYSIRLSENQYLKVHEFVELLRKGAKKEEFIKWIDGFTED